VTYKQREPSTALLLDEEVSEGPVFGRLPRPESREDESRHFARTFRHARELSETVHEVNAHFLPPTAEAFEGIDHMILASGRIAHDPVGMQALRQWLQRGGKVLVMLDVVEPEVVASLLGDALDFQVVDRVGLTTFQIDAQATGLHSATLPVQKHERPVEFVRVLLPPQERVRHTINGWPVWFSRQVGLGKVFFTTLGPRGWFGPREAGDPPSRFEHFPSLPVSGELLERLAGETAPAAGGTPSPPGLSAPFDGGDRL